MATPLSFEPAWVARSRPPTPVLLDLRVAEPLGLSEARAELWAAAETSDDRTLHHLIASGVGLALIARPSRSSTCPRRRGSPIRTNPPKRRIQAAYRSGSLERVQPVLDRLQAAAASRPAPLVLAHVG